VVLYVEEDKQAPRDTDSERWVSGIKFAMVSTLMASKYVNECEALGALGRGGRGFLKLQP